MASPSAGSDISVEDMTHTCICRGWRWVVWSDDGVVEGEGGDGDGRRSGGGGPVLYDAMTGRVIDVWQRTLSGDRLKTNAVRYDKWAALRERQSALFRPCGKKRRRVTTGGVFTNAPNLGRHRAVSGWKKDFNLHAPPAPLTNAFFCTAPAQQIDAHR